MQAYQGTFIIDPMRSGTRPSRHVHRQKTFKFGAVSASSLPDFCVDRNLWWPNQDTENAPTECVGYSAADFLIDLTEQIYTPDFSYAAACFLAGDDGSDGTSFVAGPQSLVALGGLPQSFAQATAADHGELYIADWDNWNADQKKAALMKAQNGVRNVLGNGDAFDSILTACYQTGQGVFIGTEWYVAFNTAPGGIAPLVQGPSALWHAYRIKGKKTINGVSYAMVKAWGGLWGDEGWLYFSRELVNWLFETPGTGALVIDPSALRWASLCGILVQRFPEALPVLPQLIQAGL